MMADRHFYTIDKGIVAECCRGMREDDTVAIGIATPNGSEVLRGKVHRVRRLEDDRFEIWIREP